MLTVIAAIVLMAGGLSCVFTAMLGQVFKEKLLMVGVIITAIGLVLTVNIAFNQAVSRQDEFATICKSKGGEVKYIRNVYICIKPESIITWN